MRTLPRLLGRRGTLATITVLAAGTVSACGSGPGSPGLAATAVVTSPTPTSTAPATAEPGTTPTATTPQFTIPPATTQPSASHTSAPPKPPQSTQPPMLQNVSLTRTGGIAGANDTLMVLTDGRFTVSKRSGVHHGTLTPDQLARLAALVSDPAFVAEARRGQPPSQCADAFHYTFTDGGVLASMDDCGTNGMPRFAAVISFLTSATGF